MRRVTILIVLVLLTGCGKLNDAIRPPKPKPDIAGAKAVVAGSIAFTRTSAVPDVPVPPAPKPGDKCPVCNGTGKVGDGRVFAPCGSCKGTGKVLPADAPSEIQLPVIPPQIDAPPAVDDKLKADVLEGAKTLLDAMATAVANAKAVAPIEQETGPAEKPVPPPVDPPRVATSLLDRIVKSGRTRRVIVFTKPKTCVICKTGTEPELAGLLKTCKYVIGPSTSAHVELINMEDTGVILRYDATAEEVATALGKPDTGVPLYVLIDAGGVIASSNYNGPYTAANLLAGKNDG